MSRLRVSIGTDDWGHNIAIMIATAATIEIAASRRRRDASAARVRSSASAAERSVRRAAVC
jgi:hypothetical protein